MKVPRLDRPVSPRFCGLRVATYAQAVLDNRDRYSRPVRLLAIWALYSTKGHLTQDQKERAL